MSISYIKEYKNYLAFLVLIASGYVLLDSMLILQGTLLGDIFGGFIEVIRAIHSTTMVATSLILISVYWTLIIKK
ncbi:hypothetical protein PP175_29045 (plasmid) [Aneurinibacillus sp. Ricciae_BoGa-3]|uniref:hypothetical protein n=1 Tax=Aneurinibacillus sp. Ricciae_BoGa-3 TaxID=3022697 RepID=UPI0023420BDC|nr:hypothetical protein [Aneurinibacillus sp. Ricciae_BoGa-3]WCK57239.1 hypothetical protein PP175_29045 [Aneurinibacillus sp. Ricciae_BoGa-3]